jgi:hypothetical protein
MQKHKTYQRNLKIPAILLVCLGISAASLAQPMERSVTQASFPVNMKGVARDLTYFNAGFLPSTDSSKLTINIDNPNKRKLTMHITGPSGETYYESINRTDYCRRFDFSKAEDGTYTIIIYDRNKVKMIKQININTTTEQVTRKMEITDAE